MAKTKYDTQVALQNVDSGMTPYKAAITNGLSVSTVVRAIKRREAKRQTCTKCGQIIKSEMKISIEDT